MNRWFISSGKIKKKEIRGSIKTSDPYEGENFVCNMLWSHPSKDVMGLVDMARRWDTQMVVSWWYCGEEEGQYVKPMQIKKSEDSETQQQKQCEHFNFSLVSWCNLIRVYHSTWKQCFISLSRKLVSTTDPTTETANDKLMSLFQLYRALKSESYCSYHNNIMGSFTNTKLIRTLTFITTTITI